MPVPAPEGLQRAPSWRFAYHAPCWCLDPRNKSLVPPPSPDWNKPVPRGLHVGGTSHPGGFLCSLKERRQSQGQQLRAWVSSLRGTAPQPLAGAPGLSGLQGEQGKQGPPTAEVGWDGINRCLCPHR